jgi:anti-sigma regulatory factor (Ser/Thr protein kinase)
MNETKAIVDGCYSHDLLIHDDDHELLDATVAFVQQGLSSGGEVFVHSSEERVTLLQAALGTHPRLAYGLDHDLYLSPMSTLFNYERTVARRPAGDLWVTGTVPFGPNPSAHPAWTRYESLVNEVLGRYPFHALCTYDTRALPADTVAAARATHPCLSNGVARADNPGYVAPADFLTDPRAASPCPPSSPPFASVTLHYAHDLRLARHLIAEVADAASAVDRDSIDGFVIAVHEMLANALNHGRPPVNLRVWVDTAELTCLIDDNGPGIANPLTGYRHPEPALEHGRGLWLARQLCGELIIRNSDTGGCTVLMTTA